MLTTETFNFFNKPLIRFKKIKNRPALNHEKTLDFKKNYPMEHKWLLQ